MRPAYTVFWMSGRSRGLRRFSVSERQLTAVVLSLTAAALAAAALVAHLLIVRRQAAEGHRARVENIALRARLATVRGQVAAIGAHLQRIDAMATRLYAITDLNDPERELALDLGSGARGSGEVLYAREEHIEEEDEELGSALGQALSPPLVALSAEAAAQEARVARLTTTFDAADGLLAATPSIRPVASRLVARPFGAYVDPFTRRPAHHPGIDLAAEQGTVVRAPGAGRVTSVGPRADGLGQAVTIDHGFGLTTLFGHLGEARVAPGARVRRGQVLGTVGNSGRSQGPHLHYEVRVASVAQDPEAFFLDD